MIRQILILTLLLSISFLKVNAQDSPQDQKLREGLEKYGQAEVTIAYPGRQIIDVITRNVSISAVRDKKVYITLTFSTIDWFLSRNFAYNIIEKADTKALVTASDVHQAMDWQSYPTYSDYLSIMQNFASSYPALCDLDTIGTSINGKLVLVLKISDNVKASENEPAVFYTSSMHGDEIGGFILMMRLADSLLKGYSTSQRIKNMVDNLEIWINPLANPDGTYRTGNTISSPTRGNANGYDLNRNFPDPLDPAIVPQKENVDMMKFLRKHRFVLSANFHSGSELVNYPWDRWFTRYHADDSWFLSISRAYADTVHKYCTTGYMTDENNGVTRGSDWYVIYGGRQDYVTWELQGREVTIELDAIKQTPSAQLQLLWQYNRRSLIGYIENVLYGIHGFVKDSATSAPVPARIFIKNHDKDSSQVYSDTLSGAFTRLLYPMTWNLTFTAKGYRDTTVNDVQVVAGHRTDLTVYMKANATGIDKTDLEVPLLYPNPANSVIYCKLPGGMDGTIKVSIIDNSGRKFADYDVQYVSKDPVEVDLMDLAAGIYIISFRNTLTGLTYYSRFAVTGYR